MKYLKTFEAEYYQHVGNIWFQAYMKGDAEKLAKILPKMEKEDNAPIKIFHAVNHAIKRGYPKIFDLLIDHPMINISEDNYNLFRIGCLYNAADQVKYMLDKWPEIKQNFKILHSGLEYAISHGKTKVLKVLLQLPEIDLSYGDDYLQRTESLAEDSELVKIAFSRDDFDIKRYGNAWFAYAARNQHNDSVKAMLVFDDFICTDVMQYYSYKENGVTIINHMLDSGKYDPCGEIDNLIDWCVVKKENDILEKVLKYPCADPTDDGTYSMILKTIGHHGSQYRNMDAFKMLINHPKIDDHQLILAILAENISTRYLELYSKRITPEMIELVSNLNKKYDVFQ